MGAPKSRWFRAFPCSAALLALLLAWCRPFPFYEDIGPLPPEPLVLVPDSIILQVNESAILTATGGVPPYGFSDENGPLSPNASGLSVTYTAPAEPGTYIVTLTDAQELTSESTVMVTDTAPLEVTPGAVTIGTESSVTLVASGGTGSYDFTQEAGDPGTLIHSPGEATAVYEAGGEGTFTITVTDSSLSVTSRIAVTVSGLPGALQITPISVALQTSHGITFAASGGTGPYTYSIVSGGGTIDPGDGSTYTAPDVAGKAVVRVTDAAGATSDANVEVYFPLTIVPVSVSVQVNGTYTFSATGGIAPYRYDVFQGTGFVVESTGAYTAPGASETDIVRLRDSLGNASYATVSVAAPPLTWSLQSIDTNVRSGLYTSLALDRSTGYPRIAYYASTRPYSLKLASWNGLGWSSEVIDGSGLSMRQPCSLALDPNTGYPKVAYYDGSPKVYDLKMASWNGTAWSIETVDSVGNVGQYASLALDRTTGYPRIAYYDATANTLKYASWDGSAWSIEVVDQSADVGQYASLALDPSTGYPKIAYYDATNRDLKYAGWKGLSWDIVSVDSGGEVGRYSSLALDSAGMPRIAYYDFTNRNLKYAWLETLTWKCETVDGTADDCGTWASLALDSSGDPPSGVAHISYFDATTQHLMFADKHSGSWSSGTIDGSPNVGRYSSLKLDVQGFAHIAYNDWNAQDLKYASQQ